jgi:AcrR family transcriptional regulator
MSLEPARRMRADARRTRNRLLDVLGTLLQTRGLVTLPELAREAGVSVATVYRHFDDVQELRQEYTERIVTTLTTEFERLQREHTGVELFEHICSTWVDLASRWARAASYMRTPQGFIERIQGGDISAQRLDAILRPVVQQFMADDLVAERNVDYAVLLWVTLFDDRVITDLQSSMGWNTTAVSRRLSGTYLAALGRKT